MKCKRNATILILIILGVLAFPVSNILFDPDRSGVLPVPGDELAGWESVEPVLAQKCSACHSAGAKLPFYANFPVAKGMMAKDIERAQKIFEFGSELFPGNQAPVSEVALAKLEYTLSGNHMPPRKYTALHWNHTLSGAEKTLWGNWLKSSRKAYFATGTASEQYVDFVLQPLPRKVEFDVTRVALGELLFNDTRLSGDGTVSCASCHALDKGGTDRVQFSTGIDGQVGGINSPTVYNSRYMFAQFWDGRAADLQEQAEGPVENPIEMGDSWDDVIAELSQDAELTDSMERHFGELSKTTVTEAIAEFEETLVTPGRLDDYLEGSEDALQSGEQEGFRLFVDAGCAMCHAGKILGGQSYEVMGVYEDYFEDRETTDADLGRFGLTRLERDRHRFKVPTLRNISRTGPYFHDGSESELHKAVETMATHQITGTLTPQEIDYITEFLTGLTGTYNGEEVQ